MNIRKDKITSCAFLVWLVIFSGCSDRNRGVPAGERAGTDELWIRVLLDDGVQQCELGSESDFSIVSSGENGNVLRFVKPLSEMEVHVDGEELFIGQTRIGKRAFVIADEPYFFRFNGRRYRGRLELLVRDGGGFDAINHVLLREYLAGVIGAEMPSYWEPAALEAQAIAARTYCVYIKKHFGENRQWDVRRSQANQVYLGVEGESRSVWSAVNKTAGEMLACRQESGEVGVFPAYYSSVCGGHTEDSVNVFGDSYGPLKGVECPWCEGVARMNLLLWPMVELKKMDVTRLLVSRYPKLERLGEIKEIVATRQSDYRQFSRLGQLELVGVKGVHDSLRAEDFRLSVDPSGRVLRSTACKIEDRGDKWAFVLGRGFGHAVGMCQCGAEGMARQGKSAGEILSYYYPGSQIVSMY
jgi:stage II sporulation protein D